MPVLDLLINQPIAVGPAVSTDVQDQASHAASPNHAKAATTSNAKTILFALLGFVMVIYLLHVAGRAVA